MSNVFLAFGKNTYYYTGAGVDRDVSLAIWGHESAFLEVLVVSYLMETCAKAFNDVIFQRNIPRWWLRCLSKKVGFYINQRMAKDLSEIGKCEYGWGMICVHNSNLGKRVYQH